MVREASIDFFDVPYAGGAAGRGGEAIVSVELEVDSVLEALLFGVREQVAPFGVAVRNTSVGQRV